MQIAESKDRLTLIRQFIYSLGEFLSEFTVFYPLHDIITVRLIKLYSFLVDLRHYSFISILDIPVLQYIQSTGIHRPIQKCLYLLSYRYRIFPPPQFYKYILYYVLRFFITHDARGIEKQIGVVLTEKEFISQVKVITHNPTIILSGTIHHSIILLLYLIPHFTRFIPHLKFKDRTIHYLLMRDITFIIRFSIETVVLIV